MRRFHLAGYLLLAALTLGSSPVWAQPCTTATKDTACGAGLYCMDTGTLGNNIGDCASITAAELLPSEGCPTNLTVCTAKDLAGVVKNARILNNDDCADNAIDVEVTVEYTSTASNRYDLGIFLSVDGGTVQESSTALTCVGAASQAGDGNSHSDLSDADDDLFLSQDPDVGAPPPGQDTCGDVNSSIGPVRWSVQGSVACVPNPVDEPEGTLGDLKVDSCRIWEQNSGGQHEACSDLNDAGTGSKCDCSPLIFEGIEILRADLEVIKQLEPATDPALVKLQIDGIDKLIGGSETNFDASDGDTTGGVVTGAGISTQVIPGQTHIVSEVASTDTDLADFSTSIACVDRGTTNDAGSCTDCTSVPVPVLENDDVVCTVTNTRKTDFGDAPASYGVADHYFKSGLHLGTVPTDETSSWGGGTDNNDASTDGNDDGTTFAAIGADDGIGGAEPEKGETAYYNLGVSVTNTTGEDATLTAWIDWNCDGVFAADEFKTTTVPTGTVPEDYVALDWGTIDGTTPLMSSASAAACDVTGFTFARVRLTFASETLPTDGTGEVFAGEVEDYRIEIAASTTPAIIVDFKATRHIDGGAVVAWTTASELGAVAFRAERLVGEPGEPGSHWTRAHKAAWIPSRLQLQGSNYQVFDAGASAGETHSYRVVEQTRKGRQITYGPYDLVVAAGSADLDAEQGFSVQTRYDSDRVAENLETRAIARGRVKAQSKADTQSRTKTQASAQPAGGKGAAPDTLRMQVEQTGIHGLTVQELVDAFESDTDQIETMLRRGKFRLSSRGQDIPWYEQDGMLYFYAQGPDNQFSTTRTYWLYMKQNGVRMAQADVPAAAVSEQVFIDTRDHERDALWWLSLTTDPDSDYWFWDIVSPFTPVLPVSLPIPASSAAEGELTLRLWGASNAEHLLTVRASDGDVVIGQVSFTGDVPYQTPVPLTLPAEVMGGDTLNLEVVLEANPSGDYSAVLVDGFEVSWLRNYDAVGGAISYPADGATTVTGFDTDHVVTLDIINPLAPVWVTGGAVAPDGGGFVYSANLPLSEYASADALLILKPASMELDNKSDLKNSNNRADYVVISNAELMDAALALSGYRNSDLKTMVVDIRDIYDEFTDGEPWPVAMNEFAKASQSWKTAPRYMVILGDGSFDYRDITPSGYNFVSPQMYGTSNGLFASDTLQGDINGDGIPEVAFGRVTVKSNAEGLAYVDKLSNYEAGIGELPSLLLSDLSDKGGDFKYSTFQVGEEVSGNIIGIYLQDTDIDTARSDLDHELDSGVRMLNYLGHGGMDRLSGIGPLGLLNSIDVADMNNTVTPSFIGLSCLINNYSIPGWDSLGERLVLQPGAGMVVSWAASGESYNDQATVLGVQFHSGQGNYERLGDAIIAAFQQTPDLVPIFTLLGDPALLQQ